MATGKMKKHLFVKDLHPGEKVTEMFIVKEKISEEDLIVGDKSGEIRLNVPRSIRANETLREIDPGDIIMVEKGTVREDQRGRMLVLMDDECLIKKLNKEDIFPEDFIPSLDKKDIEKMLKEIDNYIESVKDTHIKSLLKKVFSDESLMERFSSVPSSLNHHHNYIGGNIEHTLSVVKLCEALSSINNKLDRDLLIAGALLHDIGKSLEYEFFPLFDKTDEGLLSGHIIIGDRIVKEKIEELRSEGVDFPKELEMKISHMILSHHGKHEWGSPQIPRFMEALALHYADFVDAHLKYHLQKMEEEKSSGKSGWGLIWDNDLKRRKRFMLEDWK